MESMRTLKFAVREKPKATIRIEASTWSLLDKMVKGHIESLERTKHGKAMLSHLDEPVFQKWTKYPSNIEYLKINVDLELNWKDHPNERSNEAQRCWSFSRRTICSKWVLKCCKNPTNVSAVQ